MKCFYMYVRTVQLNFSCKVCICLTSGTIQSTCFQKLVAIYGTNFVRVNRII